MNLIVEFCIVFLICMAGEWIAALLPFTLPASVISLILLLILLLSGGVKERTIQGTSHFLIDNMGLFFIPSVVGTLEYLDVLKLQFVPFLVVSLVSTPLVYAATAWSVRLLMKLFHAKEVSHLCICCFGRCRYQYRHLCVFFHIFCQIQYKPRFGVIFIAWKGRTCYKQSFFHSDNPDSFFTKSEDFSSSHSCLL